MSILSGRKSVPGIVAVNRENGKIRQLGLDVIYILSKDTHVKIENEELLLVLMALLAASSFKVKAQTCKPSGGIMGKNPHAGQCNRENDLDCYVQGDDGDPSECDKHYHSNDTPVVTLSTGWYKGGDRCHKYITINGNMRSVKAMVVDQCDSSMGCDAELDYQPACPNNIVDASKALCKALGVYENNSGDLDITWSK
nr:hypothetical protein [Tanacetum cinerariifolium]